MAKGWYISIILHILLCVTLCFIVLTFQISIVHYRICLSSSHSICVPRDVIQRCLYCIRWNGEKSTCRGKATNEKSSQTEYGIDDSHLFSNSSIICLFLPHSNISTGAPLPTPFNTTKPGSYIIAVTAEPVPTNAKKQNALKTRHIYPT